MIHVTQISTLKQQQQQHYSTHQLQAERAPVGRGVVDGAVALLVPHSWVCVVPQQVFHTPGQDMKEEVRTNCH